MNLTTRAWAWYLLMSDSVAMYVPVHLSPPPPPPPFQKILDPPLHTYIVYGAPHFNVCKKDVIEQAIALLELSLLHFFKILSSCWIYLQYHSEIIYTAF